VAVSLWSNHIDSRIRLSEKAYSVAHGKPTVR
jgi:hypothetical protein